MVLVKEWSNTRHRGIEPYGSLAAFVTIMTGADQERWSFLMKKLHDTPHFGLQANRVNGVRRPELMHPRSICLLVLV
jgi:hypothetical protein